MSAQAVLSPVEELERLRAELEAARAERNAVAFETKEQAFARLSELGLTDSQRAMITNVGMKHGWKFAGRAISGWSLERLLANDK